MSKDFGKQAAAVRAAAGDGGRLFGYERGLAEKFEPGDGAIIRLVFAAIDAGAEFDALAKFLNEIASAPDLKSGRNHD